MTGFQARRANIDDLPQLITLWQAAQLPFEALEKRLTEFQVVENATGAIVAAAGLQIHGHEGLVHSEMFTDFGLSHRLRPILWERIERVAKNHGLFRLWTQETAPFWKQAGFCVPSPDILKQRPASFADNAKLEWYYHQLKDPAAAPLNLEREFERFREVERANAEDLRAKGRIAKVVAIIIALLLAAFSFIVLFRYVFYTRNHPIGANVDARMALFNPKHGEARPSASRMN
jgi:N-acetylglutamate synthase-like GNAT family acetyltransferase